MKSKILMFALCILTCSAAFSQRQYPLANAESLFYIKKDSVLHSVEEKGYKLLKKDGETYIYQMIDSKINEFQVLLTFKKNDLLYFGWTELSTYTKEVTAEMFESNYFYNGGGEEVNNDKDLAISLIVKPSENRLYIVLKAR